MHPEQQLDQAVGDQLMQRQKFSIGFRDGVGVGSSGHA
jgi:hypothetical protein